MRLSTSKRRKAIVKQSIKGGTKVSEDSFTNISEQEYTRKYEGTYTPAEIELNKKLFEECTKERVDYAAVEELLKQGADPLGGMGVSGWELLEHVYEELVYGSFDSSSINLPRITELFFSHDPN